MSGAPNLISFSNKSKSKK